MNKKSTFYGDIMFEKRTDLALEVHELHGEESGIAVKEEIRNGISVTTATVYEGVGERNAAKPAGEYITLAIGNAWQNDKKVFSETAVAVAEEISAILPHGNGAVLVVGLGNEDITPDSLGPRVVKELLITRHIEEIDPVLFTNAGFGSVAAIATGVLGQTGVESAEIVKSVCNTVNPKCVIAIDSLASRRLSRLATTVQISNSGIAPGSGVSNKRKAISRELLGVPVISLGVPTVVDAATLAVDILEEHAGKEDKAFAELVARVLEGGGREMFVTPKENDVMAKKLAKLLANALNIALHGMTADEIADFVF